MKMHLTDWLTDLNDRSTLLGNSDGRKYKVFRKAYEAAVVLHPRSMPPLYVRVGRFWRDISKEMCFVYLFIYGNEVNVM
jgi:hypothetical protein